MTLGNNLSVQLIGIWLDWEEIESDSDYSLLIDFFNIIYTYFAVCLVFVVKLQMCAF
jgi:hypothetical protein